MTRQAFRQDYGGPATPAIPARGPLRARPADPFETGWPSPASPAVKPAPARLLALDGAPIFPRMTYIITQPCIDLKDASCVDVCPVDCIYEGEDQYYIHPEECIDCGACVPECPVEAIFPDDEVPEQWQEFVAKNYVHFDVPAPP